MTIKLEITKETAAEVIETLRILSGGIITLSEGDVQHLATQGDTIPAKEVRDVSDAADEKDLEKPASAKPAKSRAKKAEAKVEPVVQEAEEVDETAAISTGDARVGPQDEPEDVQEQDAADEAAESGTKPEEGPYPNTVEGLRAAMKDYADVYGMPATMEDGQSIFISVLGPVPAGAKKSDGSPLAAWNASAVPDDRRAETIAAWIDAVAANPHGRKPV